MGLFSFLQGSSTTDTSRTGDPVQAARARARRRLIGAAALLGIGVIGFPLLFETQPRPIPVDIAIDIPKKDGAPALPLPPARTVSAAPAGARVASGVVGERNAEPARERTPVVAKHEPAPAADGTRKEPGEAAAKQLPAKADARGDDGARAKALLEGKAASAVASAPPATVVAAAEVKTTPAKVDTAAGRFVVQVGAYGEDSSARDMRQRVDKLGLKSYTQVVEVDGARRIRVRVGPFALREDAEKAAGTLKAAGLPAKVYTL